MKVVASIKETNRILETYDLKTKQSLGQNFIIDSAIIKKIVKAANITKQTVVIEIGPGIGALTQFLCNASKKVIAFEIDQRLQPALEETLSGYDNIELIFQDFLSVDVKQIIKDIDQEIIVVSNLPYYITTSIIEKVITTTKISKMIMMVQKEVAEKLTKPSTVKEISPLHIAMDSLGRVTYLFTVSRNVFSPKPKVDSAIIEYKQLKTDIDYQKFIDFLAICFKQRRKTLYNNLKKEYPTKDITQILQQENIDSTIRSELLPKEKFINLYHHIIVKG